MTNFFYWSGFAAWMIGGCVGGFIAVDWIIDQMVNSFKLKREFLAFCWDRLKASRDSAIASPEKIEYPSVMNKRAFPTPAQIDAGLNAVRDEYGSHLCIIRDDGQRICRGDVGPVCLCCAIAENCLEAAFAVNP